MSPIIREQLISIQRQMRDVIMPALGPDAEFARQSAHLIVASLEWLEEVQPFEYRYAVVENLRWRAMLEQFNEIGPRTEQSPLSGRAPRADEAGRPVADIVAETKAIKEQVEVTYHTVTDPEVKAELRQLLAQESRAQLANENSWFRLTGFPDAATPRIADVLASSAVG